MESGLIAKWSKDMVDKSTSSGSATDSIEGRSPPSLSIKNLQGAFVVMGLGMTLAIATFIIEKINYRRNVKKLNNKKARKRAKIKH